MTRQDPALNALDWFNRRALVAAGFSEQTVESPAGPQTVFTAGQGTPILLLHGAGDHAGSWSHAAPPLLAAGRYHVVIPDLAGRGTSAPYEGPLDTPTILQGLDAIIAPLAAPAILVGNSHGAWLALLYTKAQPERVDRIVAVNGAPIETLPPGITLTPSTRDEARRLWQAMLDPSRWAIPDFVLDELIRKGREGAIARLTIPPLCSLSEIRRPIDLLWGESDQLLPLSLARALGARLTTIPHCGHLPHIECAAQFNAAIARLLEAQP